MTWMLLFILMNDHTANGLTPESGKKTRLAAELTLGGEEGGDEQIFSGTTTLAVDDAGNMYVNDPKECVVKVFDKAGALTRSFGKRGQGPGEFNEPVAIALGPDRLIYVFDAGHKKMIVFGNDGSYLREARFPGAIQAVFQPVVLKSGEVAFGVFRNNEIPWSYNTTLYDANLKEIKLLHRVTLPNLDFERAGEPSFWAEFLQVHFETLFNGMPGVAPVGEEHVAAVMTHEYKGSIYNGKGLSSVSFSREYKPRVMSEEARNLACENIWADLTENPFLTPLLTKPVFERAMEKAAIPPGLLPIAAVSAFGDGFAVMTDYDVANGKGQVDFFDSKGKYVSAASFEGSCKVMYGKGDRLYIIGTDDSDALVITRYRCE